MNIRQLKLISGEEIICLIVSDNDNTYLVERPLVVLSNPLFPGKYQLYPWFGLSNSNLISIDKKSVITHAEVDDDVKETYIRLATSEYNPLQQELSFEEDYSDLLDDLVPDHTIH
jgi:hypothetical protein